jgi:PEP-CTERM motif
MYLWVARAEPRRIPLKVTSAFLVLSVVALAFIAVPASADTIAITNPSFETVDPLSLTSTAPGFGIWNNGPIVGWTITGGGAGSWQPGPAAFNTPLPDGKTIAFSNGGTLSQTLSATLSPYTTYTLSAFVGNRLDTLVTDYTIELLAGNVVLNSFSDSNGMITPGTFANESVSYTTGAMPLTSSLGIELMSNGIQSDFDHVQLSATPVPEPDTLALLATGLGLLFFVFRRR